MAIPTFTPNCPDCGAPLDMPFTLGSVRRMGSLVQIPVLVTDAAWQSAMGPHIESVPDHPPFTVLGT